MNTETTPIEVIAPGVIEQVSRAEIDTQIATAKQYPRTLSKVKADMMEFATLDEETAQACFYTLPRGGKTIQGPSVRLAEIAVSSYSNLRAGARIIAVNDKDENPHVIVQAVAHDLEKNTAITIEKRRRITKKRSKSHVDEDDITLAANACGAIAFRDAVFKVIPQALIKPVYERAMKVAIGDASSYQKVREAVIGQLKQMGATEPQILAVLEKRNIEDIDADAVTKLVGLRNALKDGEIKLEDAFPKVGQNAPAVAPAPKGKEVAK